jgi:hypothetical protein
LAARPRIEEDASVSTRHVTFDVERPARFSRGAVPLRALILFVFFIPGSINWVASLFYLPITTAVLVHQKGSERFLAEDHERLTVLIGWIVGIYSYFAFLTDRFALDARESSDIHFGVEPSGTPTTRSALLRIVTSLPNVIVFGVFGIAALGVWLIAGFLIFVTGNYPRSLYAYQRGINRWQARLFTYHTSLVDNYPPFALSLGRETSGTTVPAPTLESAQ